VTRLTVEKNPDPKVIREVAATAPLSETVSKNMADLLLKAKEADLKGPAHDLEIAKGNAKPPTAWVTAPAKLELSALADRRLSKIASWAGTPVKLVARVHARIVGESKVLLLKPAPDSDRTATPVARYEGNSGAQLNLYDLLASHGLTIATGYRERFDVFYVPQGSALWPGLVIDLGVVKERRAVRGKKKEAETK